MPGLLYVGHGYGPVDGLLHDARLRTRSHGSSGGGADRTFAVQRVEASVELRLLVSRRTVVADLARRTLP
jgi:hypothetical protein